MELQSKVFRDATRGARKRKQNGIATDGGGITSCDAEGRPNYIINPQRSKCIENKKRNFIVKNIEATGQRLLTKSETAWAAQTATCCAQNKGNPRSGGIDVNFGEVYSREICCSLEVSTETTKPARIVTNPVNLKNATDGSQLRESLSAAFGWENFREGQEEAVRGVLEGRDCLVIMPTGGGKSVTYMLPGLLLPGVVLIVSPLLALIEDQVQRLKLRGLSAACLNSTMPTRQKEAVVQLLLHQADDSQQMIKTGNALSLGTGKVRLIPGVHMGPDALESDARDAIRSKNCIPAALESCVIGGDSSDGIIAKCGENGRKLKFLFVTPEQIATSTFQNILRRVQQQHGGNGVALVAVDEAHCISSWGHDFRGSYRRLGLLRNLLPGTPILACTATATLAVQRDICESLFLKDPVAVRLSFNRGNIFYEVRLKAPITEGHAYSSSTISEQLNESESLDDRDAETDFAIRDIVKEIMDYHRGEIGIVYCFRKVDCDLVAEELRRGGVLAAAYHAGLPDHQRKELQGKWMTGAVAVLVATVAFGLGVDNPRVRFVVHFSLPKTVEAFYQESGRGGRDGGAARSILYFSRSDYALLEFLTKQQYNQKITGTLARNTADNSLHAAQTAKNNIKQQHERALKKLQAVLGYCLLTTCRRKYLLQEFGEDYIPPTTVAVKSGSRCCDNCHNPSAAASQGVTLARNAISLSTKKSIKKCLGAPECRPVHLEIETQDIPDSEGYRNSKSGTRTARHRAGRVVYNDRLKTNQTQEIPTSVRNQGLSAVMRELERREERACHGDSQASGGNGRKRAHPIFAEFCSARTLTSSGHLGKFKEPAKQNSFAS